jgi:hypothetical protein
LAFEIHGHALGLDSLTRVLNDLDFITGDFASIPETLSQDFLFRHIHPDAAPGKTMLQLIDCDAALRVDIFRACSGTLRRAAGTQVVALEDLVARVARLLFDLADGVPVASKHANDYLRFVELVAPAGMEAAWQDHRKPMHPATFREAQGVLRAMIPASAALLITPRYSQNPSAACPRCAPTGAFQLADANVILSLLGYC